MKKDVRGDISAIVVPSLTERAAEIRLASAQQSERSKLVSAGSDPRAAADSVHEAADESMHEADSDPSALVCGLDDGLDGWSTDTTVGDRQGSETPPTRSVSPTYDDAPPSPKPPTVSPFFNVLLNNSLTMEFFVF